jgi:hypothetical protein
MNLPEEIYVHPDSNPDEGQWHKADVFSCEGKKSIQYIRSDIVTKLLSSEPLAQIGKSLLTGTDQSLGVMP